MASQLYSNLADIYQNIVKCNKHMETILANYNKETEYEVLQYIKSTGIQQINTGIVCKDTIKFQVKFSIGIHTGGLYFGATTAQGEADAFRFFSADAGAAAGAQWYLDYGSGEGTSSGKTYNRIFGGAAKLNTVYEFEIGNRYIKDMETSTMIKSASSVTFADKTYTFNIFGPQSLIDLYYCKIYDGNTLVRDYIPVKRKSDGKVGLYDKITEAFYFSGGSEVFEAGPNVLDTSIQSMEESLGILAAEISTKLSPNLLSAGTTFLGITGAGPIYVETVEDLANYLDVPENTMAVIRDEYYKGTYQLIEGSWEQIGEPVNVGDDTLTKEQYDTAVLSIDNILGINEEE